MDGTIPFLACNTASGTVQATIPGQGTNVGAFQWNKTCEAPTEESSTFDMWDSAQGLDTVPGFSVQLRPTSVNFAGRIVQESASGTVQDTCHDAIPNNGSAIGVVNPNSIWAVNSTDHYVGDDFVGYFPASVFYYRLQLFRITGNTNFSCGFTVHQQMKMNSCGSTTIFAPYGGPEGGGTNTLRATITSTTVTSQRGNAQSPTLTFP
jgi:hypothetical protein